MWTLLALYVHARLGVMQGLKSFYIIGAKAIDLVTIFRVQVI